MKILANDGISPESKSALENAGYVVVTEKVEQEDLINKINEENYEIVLVRSATQIREDIIDNCPNLKLIGRGGVGMDNISVSYARERGIKVINTPASSSQSVSELVMGQFFSLSRSLHDSAKNMNKLDFDFLKKRYSKGTELRGKTLGIIGFGRIGQSLASYAIGMGIKVLAVDIEERYETIEIELPWTTSEGQDVHNKVGVKIKTTTSIDELLPKCDLISVHIPKQENGDSVINEREFNLMKKGTLIVNAARGGVVNEDDLIFALESGQVGGIALDVFEDEPNPNRALLNHSKIATTPHIGAATIEAQDRIGLELAELIKEEFGTFKLNLI